MNETEALVILAGLPNIGSIKSRLLIEKYGSALAALDADKSDLAQLPGFGPKLLSNWESWKNNSAWEQNLELADQQGVEILTYRDPRYPKRLLELPDYPVLLYVKGTLKKEDSHSIAVVGTRQASLYGLDIAERMGRDLASMQFTVVSGLARGVDTRAHKGALESGHTIAVIGSGLCKIYPSENQKLADAISENGAVISEFAMMTPPDRQNFPKRNRIVSGMTMGTLLIEAPLRSGAMITMNLAHKQKRRLFTIPGRCDQQNFKGNHDLIKSGRAQLVEDAKDIAFAFDSLFTPPPVDKKAQTVPPLDLDEMKILQHINGQELTIDEMVNLTKLPVSKLSVLLMSLVLKRVIKEHPGKVYKSLIHSG